MLKSVTVSPHTCMRNSGVLRPGFANSVCAEPTEANTAISAVASDACRLSVILPMTYCGECPGMRLYRLAQQSVEQAPPCGYSTGADATAISRRRPRTRPLDHDTAEVSTWPTVVRAGRRGSWFGECAAERRSEHFPRGDEQRRQDGAQDEANCTGEQEAAKCGEEDEQLVHLRVPAD